jgi:N,N'-diacetyllegionaminate synthase
MPIWIGGQPIGAGYPLFVIAEIGLNHGGSTHEALALVDAAVRADASAIKLQTLFADGLVAAHCPPPAHVAVASLRDFFRQFELDEPAHRAVVSHARACGLAVMSTPFDEAAVDLLERVGVDAYKIASGDITHRRLIERVSQTGKPVVMSTGMSDLADVRAGLAWARDAGARDIVLLHCVSAYPVPAGSENLGAVRTLAEVFDVPVGLSDHGAHADSLAVAAALGACVYERHLITREGSQAIDAAVSSTPDALRAAVMAAEVVRRAVGHGRKECLAAEGVNRHASRRGLYLARSLAAGAVIAAADVRALRPADGIGAADIGDVIGARLVRDVNAGTVLTWDDVAVGRRDRAHAV